ncbi:hypothetical protein ACF0H5_022478 [Mactra antiquata]
MKFLIALLVCSFAALIQCEQCILPSSCSHVTCDAGHALECHNFQCTCSDHAQASCSAPSDCSGTCSRTWHCVDALCRCGYGISIPGIGK